MLYLNGDDEQKIGTAFCDFFLDLLRPQKEYMVQLGGHIFEQVWQTSLCLNQEKNLGKFHDESPKFFSMKSHKDLEFLMP